MLVHGTYCEMLYQNENAWRKDINIGVGKEPQVELEQADPMRKCNQTFIFFFFIADGVNFKSSFDKYGMKMDFHP